jgi:hypothetical protein
MADYFRFHLAWLKQAERLSESERGRLLAGIAEYSQTGIVPEFRGNERYLFPLLSPAPDAPSEAEKQKKPQIKSEFERFWEVYPRKIGKGAAQTAFEAALNKPKAPTADRIIQSVIDHKATWNWKKENGQFIPHPSTYLHQERWKDDLTNEPKNPPPKGKRGNWVEIEQNTLTDEQLKRIEVDLDKDIE